MLAARLGTGAGLAAAADASLLKVVEPVLRNEKTLNALLSAHQMHRVGEWSPKGAACSLNSELADKSHACADTVWGLLGFPK